MGGAGRDTFHTVVTCWKVAGVTLCITIAFALAATSLILGLNHGQIQPFSLRTPASHPQTCAQRSMGRARVNRCDSRNDAGTHGRCTTASCSPSRVTVFHTLYEIPASS